MRKRFVVVMAALMIGVGGYVAMRSGPPLVVVAQRVHDIDPNVPTPRLVLAVIFGNESDQPIRIVGDPGLRVRTVATGGEQRVRSMRQAEGVVEVPPHGRVELVYDLWQLTNLYQQGFFRDLRDAPQNMRFRLEVETGTGLFRSDEWAGVTSGTDVGELLRELRGGVAL